MYDKHNYKPNDVLYASQLNETDDQILKNETEIAELKKRHDIKDVDALKAMIDLIYSGTVVDKSGNAITIEQLQEIVVNILATDKNAYGANSNQIPFSDENGKWGWTSIADAIKGSDATIGEDLTIGENPIFGSRNSIAFAIKNAVAYIMTLIEEGGGGAVYKLPILSSKTLGGARAEAKTADDTQPVHSDAAGFLWTKPGTSGGMNINGIYIAEDNGISRLAEDNTQNLQKLINDISKAGGGVIVFGAGTYKWKSVDMEPGVSIAGSGINVTTFLYCGANNGTVTDSSQAGDKYTAMIHVPSYSYGNDFYGFTMLGTSADWIKAFKGQDALYNQVMYHDMLCNPLQVSGIIIDKSTSAENGIAQRQWWLDHTIPSGYKGSAYWHNYNFSKVHDIAIIGFSGYGIKLGQSGFFMHTDTIFINNCGCGFVSDCTDSYISNVSSDYCMYEGFIVGASSTSVNNIKAKFCCAITKNKNGVENGRYSPFGAKWAADNGSGYVSDYPGTDCYAIVFRGNNLTVVNAESQDSVGNGIAIACLHSEFHGLVVDNIGKAFGQVITNLDQDCDALSVKARHCTINASLRDNQYNGRPSGRYGLNLYYSCYNDISVRMGSPLPSGGAVVYRKIAATDYLLGETWSYLPLTTNNVKINNKYISGYSPV